MPLDMFREDGFGHHGEDYTKLLKTRTKSTLSVSASIDLGAWTHLPVSVMQETTAEPNLAHRLV